MIGFKNTNNKLEEINDSVKEEITNVEEIIQRKGLQEAHLILVEYLSRHSYPFLQKEKRDEVFMERLRKVRERYFLPI